MRWLNNPLVQPFVQGVHTITEWCSKQDEQKWNEFEQIIANADANGLTIGEVTWIRKFYPHKGTKAWVRWIKSENRDAVWVEYQQLRRGQVFAASGSHGYGRHHQETVFYVDGRCHSLSRRVYRGWVRHQVRQSRAATPAGLGALRHVAIMPVWLSIRNAVVTRLSRGRGA